MAGRRVSVRVPALLTFALAVTSWTVARPYGATATQAPKPRIEVVYAIVGDAGARKDLRLDLYLPAGKVRPPLVVWVHGGAWRSGSKAQPPMAFVENGFAMASLDFRLSTEARFPAAIHDIKAAVRFLRAKASEFGYRSDRIAIAGSSSGGHLAALVGVTNGHKELEGTLGGYLNESSDIAAIVDYFGASDLLTIVAQSTPHGVSVRVPALDLLFGAQPDAVKPLAELASPVFHVDKRDPPLLLIHGDQDPQMPINQSHELQGAYEKLGLDVTFDVVHGGAHGGNLFWAPEHLNRALAFLRRTIGE